MKNTNTNFESMNLSPEVTAQLQKYNSTIDSALDAVQRLEAICISSHLAEFFGSDTRQTARAIKQDYLVVA